MPQNNRPKEAMEKFLKRCFVIILLSMLFSLLVPPFAPLIWIVGGPCLALLWLASLFWLVFFRFKFSLAQMLVSVLVYATAMTVTKAMVKDDLRETELLVAFAFGHSLALGLGMVIGLNNIAVMGEIGNFQRWFLFICGLLFLHEIFCGIASAFRLLLNSSQMPPLLIIGYLLVVALSAVCFITTGLCLTKKVKR